MKNKNILLTGGAGFIGSNFINYFLDKYNNTQIINLDVLTYAANLNHIKNKNNYIFIEGDISDQILVKHIFHKYNIDGVINFAAETHVDNSIKNPEIFIKTNINGTFNLLNNAYNFWMNSPFKHKTNFKFSRFHQISTDEVYGSTLNESFKETSNYSPNSPYSASKASADMLVRSFNKTYGLNTSISISSNNFGINQNDEKFIPKIINSIIKKESIPVYGDGLNIRDWICVEDHCRAIDIIFKSSKSGHTYNVSANNELTNIDLIELIYESFNKSIERKKMISYVSDRFGHDRRYSLDNSKIKNDLGWMPSNNFKFQIQKLIEYYLSKSV